MEHKITIVEKKELNDQYVSYKYRCCDDPSTDSWHSFDLSLPEDEVTEAVNVLKTRVAQKHEYKVNHRKGDHHVHKIAGAEATVTI